MLKAESANIIKQEMRNAGGDAAIARDAVGCRIADRDVILMGTLGQIRCFAEKITDATPRSERDIGTYQPKYWIISSLDSVPLKTSRREMVLGERTLIMGILNVTPDSFSDGNRFASPEVGS